MTEFSRFNRWKVLAYSDRIQKIIKGEIPEPVVWHIYPSNLCNNRCPFCIMELMKEHQRFKGHIPKEWFGRILDDTKEHNIKLVHISGGGEPFTHPNMYEFFEKARNYPVKISVSSNGSLIKDPKCLDGIDYLRISLNAGTPEMYSKVSGVPGDNFNKVIENTERLIKYRNKNNLNVDISWAFVILPENWQEIYKFCWLASKIGVDFVHIRPAYLPDDSELMYHVPEITEIAERAKKDFSRKLNVYYVTYKFDSYWNKREYSKCWASFLYAVMLADGQFSICQDVFEPRFGNYATQSFKDIWWSEDHLNVWKTINKRLDKCPRCVESSAHTIIEKCFIGDEMRRYLI